MKKCRQSVRFFRLPFPKCVLCSPTCSGLRLAARRCSLPGPGGGVATRAVPVSFIPSIVVLRGKTRSKRLHTNSAFAVSHSRETPGRLPGLFPQSHEECHCCFSKRSLFHDQSFIHRVLSLARR